MINNSDISYEEIKDVIVYILSNPDKLQQKISQFADLNVAVTAEIAIRAGKEFKRAPLSPFYSPYEEMVREVFWELFRLGYITLGLDSSNPSWPWFKLSRFGQSLLSSRSPWRFHDSSSYLNLIKNEVPNIQDISINYLQEAIDCFYSGSYLASTVMLGVAAEAEFLELLNVASNNIFIGTHFKKSCQTINILKKIEYFLPALDMIKKDLLYKASEDFNQNFLAIQSVLRIARNEAGHPTGSTPPNRESLYVHLQLFIPFARQLMRLKETINSLKKPLTQKAKT